MEGWSLGYKAILLFYIMGVAYLGHASLSPWFILSILFYCSLNIASHIGSKRSWLLPLFSVLSILLILLSAYSIESMILLLLPPNLYELISYYLRKVWPAIFFMISPLLLLQLDQFSLYLLIALLSYIFYTNLQTSTEKIERYRHEQEDLHQEVFQLTKRLHENNEWMKQSEYSSKLEERNRLSQEIHDKVGHAMTGALIQMEASKRLLHKDPEQSVALLNNAIHISKDGIETVRRVLHNMKPPTEQLGINRLKLILDEFSSNHSIQPSFMYKGNLDLITPMQWRVIQENTREALTNTMRYADATTVSVDIQVLNTLIRVEVLDNGSGVHKVKKGLGITGMEERTAAVNGTIIVDGSRGFSVTMIMPYAKI